MELKLVALNEIDRAMKIIDEAKQHLKTQGIDQWQNGYPDYKCIENDIKNSVGYFIISENVIMGYLCISFDKEVAYEKLDGQWGSDVDYVVVHRWAFTDKARGKKMANDVISCVEVLSKERNINYFRIDTDENNEKMKHILKTSGFKYRGTIWFDNSEKLAFDKII